MLRNKMLKVVLGVGFALIGERAVHGVVEFHIVVAVHSKNVFHYVAGSLHIDALGGDE